MDTGAFPQQINQLAFCWCIRNYNDADSEDDSYEDDYCDMEYDKNCEEES